MKGLSADRVLSVDKILENQKQMLSGSSSSPTDLRKVMMPMIRKILPTTIMADIMSVQPMTGPTGNIFTIRPDIDLSVVRLKITKVDAHWNIECRGASFGVVVKIEEWLKSYEDWEYWTYQKGPWSTFFVNLYDEESVAAFKLTWDNYEPNRTD